MRRNVASQVVGAQLVSASDGSAFTGSVTCYVSIDGATQVAGSTGSGACTHKGNGFHNYVPTQGETNGSHVAFTFVGSGAVPVTVQVYPKAYSSTGVADVNVTQFGGTAGTFSAGRPEVNTTHWAGGAVATPDATGHPKVTVKSGTGAGEISLASGRAAADVTAWNGTVLTGALAALNALGIVAAGTAQSGGSSAIQLAAGLSIPDSHIIGSTVAITGGTGVGQSRVINAWNNTTKQAGVETPWTTAPDNTSTYEVLATPRSTASSLTANDVRDAVLNAVLASFTSAGSLGERLGRIPNAAAGGNGGLPTVDSANRVAGVSGNVAGSVGSVTGNVGGNVTGSVGSIASGGIAAVSFAADSITASALATSAAAEIQSGLATAANLVTVAGYIDTEVAAILTIAQKLDTALELDGSVYRFTVNALENAPVSGGGGSGDWTTGEKEEIRYRLGLTGTATAPGSATPTLATAAAVAEIAGFVDTLIAELTDARGEPGQGAPPVSADIATKIDYLYKLARNRIEQTSSELRIYGDDGTTIHHKAPVSDTGSATIRGELTAGP